jgi:hypothetical protein
VRRCCPSACVAVCVPRYRRYARARSAFGAGDMSPCHGVDGDVATWAGVVDGGGVDGRRERRWWLRTEG